MLTERFKIKIEEILHDRIIDSHSVSGGCINDAKIISVKSGDKYFIKTNHNNPKNMFLNEANGLREIAKAQIIKTPEIIYVDDEIILLEAISAAKRISNFFEDFGRKFAQLHKFTHIGYGFYEDNYIGSNRQINIATNIEKKDWCEFYFNKRLKYQFDLCEKNGVVTEELRKLFLKLENKIESIIEPKTELASLLHGDLWGGNYMIDEKGEVCLIDPAVYYGNREADLAMTKLFGGFDSNFYSAYNQEFPLEDGYEYRENIYKLYHILNHLNLFGSSYYTQALNLVKYYL